MKNKRTICNLFKQGNKDELNLNQWQSREMAAPKLTGFFSYLMKSAGISAGSTPYKP